MATLLVPVSFLFESNIAVYDSLFPNKHNSHTTLCLSINLEKVDEVLRRSKPGLSFLFKEIWNQECFHSNIIICTMWLMITEDRNNKLHDLLPERNACHFNFRKKRKFNANFKTNRLKNSFFLSNALQL